MSEYRQSSASDVVVNSSSFLNLIESYLTYYADGYNHTARAKRLDLQHFVKFLTRFVGVSKADKLKVSDWSTSATQAFVEEKLRSNESPATVARRLATLKHMGRTLAEKNPGFINPAREVKTPKIAITKPKGLIQGDIAKVKKRSNDRIKERDNFIRHRNQFLFDLLLDTGLRAEEVRLLRLSQVDDNLEWIKNVRTKGKRYRNVYMTSAIRADMKKYLNAREECLKRFFPTLTKTVNRTLPLFISTYNADPSEPDTFLMGPKTLWRAINELSQGKALHPHLLRHSFALDLLNSSNDIRLVAQALGHGDVRVTMRYTERSAEEVAAALEKSRRNKRS